MSTAVVKDSVEIEQVLNLLANPEINFPLNNILIVAIIDWINLSPDKIDLSDFIEKRLRQK